ncbi:TPA: winged helix-turn-helix transcriptional regulator, partial [Streptococcus pyogenes]|nr:winged helix-turn-helix transcriptional regulator [Streptococcus pyogenes]
MDYYDKFKALSDPIRLDILNELNNGELSAGDIADKFALPNSKISYHLAILKKVDMV